MRKSPNKRVEFDALTKAIITEYDRDGLVKAVDGLSFTLDRGRTLGIVGYGSLGRSVADLGRCLGMEVVVSARPGCGGSPPAPTSCRAPGGPARTPPCRGGSAPPPGGSVPPRTPRPPGRARSRPRPAP